MLDPQELLDMVLIGNYPGVTAALIFILLAVFKKFRPHVWERIPTSYRWLVPIGLGYAEAFGASLSAGMGWGASALVGLRGVVEGLIAMGTHNALSEAPGPYNAKPKEGSE